MKKLLFVCALSALSGCAIGGSSTATPPSTPVFFKPQSAGLDQNARATIATVADAARAKPDAPVIVVGTTEDKGNPAMSNALSQARAQAVAAELEADGVAKNRLRIYGAGAVDAPKGLNISQGARRVLISIGP